ncbi:protein-cysteine N-palmitoyltransferase Rasp [Episyrphus balteatus]|uniref:protein-cysteine N-palmitoyltransferase Rasp n=1 Tax=Episyrphus balteatus TaxID=286459 RepID=UPI0024867AA6|nr:protein-cysteine N-palmitoyltransferase Rasp [Episyrphus balteatus]
MLLPKYETYFYLCVYLLFLAHGLAKLFNKKDKVLTIAKVEFNQGWTWIGRPQDNTNDEFEYFKDFLWKNAHWYGIHLIVCECCRIFRPNKRNIAHTCVGLAFLFATFKVHSLIVILLELLSFYVTSNIRSKSLTWIVAISWMCGINFIKNSNELYEFLGYREYYELIISLAWCVLKCLSFNLSKVKDERNDIYNLGNFLGYTVYFPVFVHGPFMIFDRYVAFTKEQSPQYNRYLLLLKRLIKVFFWLFALDFALHFIYIHYMEKDIDAVKLLSDSYGLYAFGYFMGQFFHVFYVITYGLGIAFASFDGLNPPNPPICIGYINFYSDMWKYFDQGLYEFLFKHIYAELCTKHSSSLRKIFSALGTFFFVYIWHGYYLNILIWSLLNVACLILEKLLKYTISCNWYREKIAQRLSATNQQRLYAVLGTQIFIPSAFSNFYFFSGKEIGNYFMQLTYCNGLWYYLSISFYCYCLFQSAEYFVSKRKIKY